MKQGVVSQSFSASSACSAVIRHFEQISEAPDAVPRLRRFILDLAMRGKLVEQGPADEPVSELLKHVEKANMPFEIPSTWVSIKAGRLFNMQYGKALPASDRSDHGRVPVFGSNGIVGYCEIALSQEPAIIIGRKGSAGALNLCDGPSWTTDVAYFLIPSPFFNIRFLLVVLKTLDLGSLGKGVKPGLNRAEVYQLPVVVPPLAEQNRIVAKVDELMALCDELEASQAKRERRRDRLVAATLAGLTAEHAEHTEVKSSQPFSAYSACSAVPFFLNHLPRLTTRPEHIQQLRQTILDLAVRGKLVPQDEEDEPAQILLSRLMEQRSSSPLPEIKAADFQFSIPSNWVWVQMGKVYLSSFYGPRFAKADYVDDGIPTIRTTDMTSNGKIMLKDPPRVAIKDTKKLDSYLLKPNDLLITRSGTIGMMAVFRDDYPALPSAYLIRLRFPCEVSVDYFFHLLRSPYGQDLLGINIRSIGVPNVNATSMSKFPIPLPPLTEQNRIVAKVNELMELCDELENSLTSTAKERRQLLNTTLHEALYGLQISNILE